MPKQFQGEFAPCTEKAMPLNAVFVLTVGIRQLYTLQRRVPTSDGFARLLGGLTTTRSRQKKWPMKVRALQKPHAGRSQ
jgi:hypothetical protein